MWTPALGRKVKIGENKSLDDILAMITPNNIHSEVTTKKYLEQRAKKASVEKFKNVLSKAPGVALEDFSELEKDITRTSMNEMWEELKNDTW